VREDPIFSGGIIKAALVILVAGALGVGAYVLASGVDINLPDLPDVETDGASTRLSDTTLEDTTIDQPKPTPAPAPASGPSIEDLQELGRCTQTANGDIDKINACFDRFNGQ
jgi:hypothetical protein